MKKGSTFIKSKVSAIDEVVGFVGKAYTYMGKI